MADETMINGTDDRTVEIAGNEDRQEVFVDFDEGEAKATGLMQRIEALEKEKRELVRENEAVRERVKKLKEEIEGSESDKAELKREIERSEADKRALESIAARAAELETSVSRMQHDLISSMSDGEEANKEVSELKRVVEELKLSLLEKESKVEVLEEERNLLLEKLEKDAEGLNEAKAVAESRVCELEKKIVALKERESSEKSERIKIELEARAKIDEKESEIGKLKKRVEDLDSVVAKNGLEMERMKMEREELEIMKNESEALLKESERKDKEMEHNIVQLQQELKVSEQRISWLEEEKTNDINSEAEAVGRTRDVNGEGEMGVMGLKQQWPVVAVVSTGAIAAAVAVIYYLRCSRPR